MQTNVAACVSCSVIAFLVGYFSAGHSSTAPRQRPATEAIQSHSENTSGSQITSNRFQLRPRSMNDGSSSSASQDPSTNTQQALFEQKAFDEWVSKKAAERNPEFATLFSSFGLGPDQIAQFQSNVITIHRKAISAGKPVDDLQQARRTYDDEVRSTIGEENYAKYRAYEALKAPRLEYERLRDYAKTKMNIDLDPASSDALINLIKEAQVYTTESWDGPYDPPPRPMHGRQQLTELLQRQIDEITQRSSLLLEATRQTGTYDDKSINAIQRYYTDTLLEKAKFLAAVDRTEEEQISDLEQRESQFARDRLERKSKQVRP
jgi:hypothetical protein